MRSSTPPAFLSFLPMSHKAPAPQEWVGLVLRKDTPPPVPIRAEPSFFRPRRIVRELRVGGLQDEFVREVVDLIVRIDDGDQG